MDTNKTYKPKYNLYIGITVSILMTLVVLGYYAAKQPNISTFQEVATKETEALTDNAKHELETNGITVLSVKPNDTVQSPILVTGQVKKDKFPGDNVTGIVVDDNGQVLKVTGIALGSSSAGTASFSGEVEYENPSAQTGKLILEGAYEDEDGTLKFANHVVPITFSEGVVAGAASTQ